VGDRRCQVERNVAGVLGTPDVDPRARALAHQSVRNFGRMAIDFLATCTMSEGEVWRWVTPVGEPYVAAALARGHGVIFAMPHVGSWDVAGAYAAAYHVKLTGVIDNNWLAQLVAGARSHSQSGVALAPANRSMRALFQALSRNEGVVLLSDVADERIVQTIGVPFFGRPARFPIGPARLALRTGAPIIVLCCVRLSDGTYRIEGQPPLWPDPHLQAEQSVSRLTAAMAAGFERIIAQYPEHWYPFHPIWADVPAGGAVPSDHTGV
jgi:KDO2-lipid IV(A) lauroyltransferase